MTLDPKMPDEYKAPVEELIKTFDANGKISIREVALKYDVHYTTLTKYYKKAVDLRLGYHLTKQMDGSIPQTTQNTLDFLKEDYATFSKETLNQKKQAQELIKDSIKLSRDLVKSIPNFEELQSKLRLHADAGDSDARVLIGILSKILKALEATSFRNIKELVSTITALDKGVAESLFLPYGTAEALDRNKKLKLEIEIRQEQLNQIKKGGDIDYASFFDSSD